MTSRTPPLLEPYLSPLPSSAGAGALLLATSVLGASTNWLVLRLLHSLLLTKPSKPAAGSRSEGEDEGEGEVAVVLVSFLRDLSFWREAVARLGGGIDLAALGRRGRFGFIDGLSSAPGVGEAGGAAGTRWMRALAMSAAAGAEGDLYDNIRRAVLEVVELLKGTGEEKGRRVVLVVDGLDFVLASAPAPAAPSARDLLMDLREVCFMISWYHTITRWLADKCGAALSCSTRTPPSLRWLPTTRSSRSRRPRWRSTMPGWR